MGKEPKADDEAVRWVIEKAEDAWQSIAAQNIPPGSRQATFGGSVFFVEVSNPLAEPGLGRRQVAITTNLKKTHPTIRAIITHFEKDRVIGGIRLAKRSIQFGDVKTRDSKGKENTSLCIYIL